MLLSRQSITPANRTNIIDAQFDSDTRIFTASTPSGFAVYRTWPLTLLRKRDMPNGTLAKIVPLHSSSLLFLVGGGRSPLYPPNKIIVWDDHLGRAVAELEYNEKVAGLACRRGWLVVALKQRVLVYQLERHSIKRWGEELKTCKNERGLLALSTAPNSTLLALPGRQIGHVQLVHLPPCPAPPPPPVSPPSSTYSLTTQPPPDLHSPPPSSKSGNPKPIILAHETLLRCISVPPSGNLVATASNRGTLVRIWNSHTGEMVRELRRGTDKAEIYGIAFRRDEGEVCCWSDKGTVHVFKLGTGEGDGNRHSTLAPLTPFIRLPKYFSAERSYAQYRLPSALSNVTLATSGTTSLDADAGEEEKCVVGWIQVPIAPPAIPPQSPTSGTATTSSPRKGKQKEDKPKIAVEHQLVALTYSGGWYRLSFPLSSSSKASATSTSSASPLSTTATPMASAAGSVLESAGGLSTPVSTPPTLKGKERERRILSDLEGSVGGSTVGGGGGGSAGKSRGKESDGAKESGRSCVLEEFRRFGRWDGWG